MARRRRRGQEPPSVRPVDVDGVRTVAIGTVLWAVAFVMLAVFRDALDEQGMGWWLWTCLAGMGLGLLGLEYTRKRRDAIARARLQDEADRPDDADFARPEDEEYSGPDDAESPVEYEAAAAEADMRPQAEPEPVRAEPEPEPEPVRAEPEPVGAEPEPAPEPVQVEPEPEPARQPEPVRAQPPQPAEWAEAELLDTGPPVPAPESGSRRTRRAVRSVQDSDPDLDEPLLPMASDFRNRAGDRPTGGRRARRDDDSTDDDQVDEDGTLYRGRRARRP